MNIKMVDLHGQYLRIKQEIDDSMQEVLDTTAFIQGKQVIDFAAGLAAYCNVKSVIPCANGTDALQIAMMALDLQPGDEVILPVHTYVATAEVIALLRLKPVFVDVEEQYFTLRIDQVAERISPRTKAIVPVHLYGQCADMDALLRLADQKNVHVIEDVAQALGARYTFPDGKVAAAGAMGTIGCTSFFPSKNLGCFGDGGALMTQDEMLSGKIRMMANHGQRVKYQHDEIGVNSRLDTLQAAVLNVKLRYLSDYERRRNWVASYYDRSLAGAGDLILPARRRESTHVFHQYTIRTDRRDALKSYLEERGIPSMIYYPIPLHLQKAYRQPGVERGAFPVTERLSETVLSLPIHTEMDDSQLGYICDTIRGFFTK
ncbi:MAG: DegT/DnrJ/EryC1/StrS family aminotransferase [Cyclobacteriaceae bacterium]